MCPDSLFSPKEVYPNIRSTKDGHQHQEDSPKDGHQHEEDSPKDGHQHGEDSPKDGYGHEGPRKGAPLSISAKDATWSVSMTDLASPLHQG